MSQSQELRQTEKTTNPPADMHPPSSNHSQLAIYTVMETDDHSSSSSSSADVSLSSSQSCLSRKPKSSRRKFKDIHHPVYQCIRENYEDKRICDVPKPPRNPTSGWRRLQPQRGPPVVMISNIFLHSSSAPMNFSESFRALPPPRSVSLVDIRIAEAEMSRSLQSNSRGRSQKWCLLMRRRFHHAVVDGRDGGGGYVGDPISQRNRIRFEWS